MQLINLTLQQLKTLLVIGTVWPEPNSSAAGGRMMQLMAAFQQKGYSVVFASPAMDSDFMINLEQHNIEKKSILLNSETFDHFIKELSPEIVLFDRFMMEEQFGWRVADNCPNALRLLDTEDLHCLRVARQNAFKKNTVFKMTDLLSEAVAKREIASILRCDLSLIISEFEMHLLINLFKVDSSLLYYLPFQLESVSIESIMELPSFENRSGFVFIGNFLHEPNWNAVQYLKETLWPLIRKQMPTAVLSVYGAYPSPKVLQLHDVKTGFLIQGRVENASEVVHAARVVLAPLRFGAGQKGKLVEAMQCGTPSITTSIGAESMHGDLAWNGYIVDDAVAFANNAVELYNNKVLWLQAQENGVAIINQRYLREKFTPHFMAHLNHLQQNLAEHRVFNFMGSMLQHHTLNSTKYMSRWIEAKNKV